VQSLLNTLYWTIVNSVDIWCCVIFICRVTTARASSTPNNGCLTARLCLFKTRAGKQRLWLAAYTWGSERIDLGVVSPAVIWREVCGWQKPPGIRHDVPSANFRLAVCSVLRIPVKNFTTHLTKPRAVFIGHPGRLFVQLSFCSETIWLNAKPNICPFRIKNHTCLLHVSYKVIHFNKCWIVAEDYAHNQPLSSQGRWSVINLR
jgi:hypothetical protein